MDHVRYVTVDDTGVDEKNLHLPEGQRFSRREFQPALAASSEGEKSGKAAR